MSHHPSKDRLGKLIQKHEVTLGTVLLISGVIGLVGVGTLVFATTRQPISLAFLVIGTAALLLSFALVGINVFNVGRRLELRKRGIRFCETGVVTELLWDEITDVEVKRTDDTYLGAVTLRKRSADTARPSGLLTKTEWDVTIHGNDGRRIHLSPVFLRTLPNPRKLISHLQMRAGLPPDSANRD